MRFTSIQIYKFILNKNQLTAEDVGFEPTTLYERLFSRQLNNQLFNLPFVGAVGFEPTIRADYEIYSLAPNQFELYPLLYIQI